VIDTLSDIIRSRKQFPFVPNAYAQWTMTPTVHPFRKGEQRGRGGSSLRGADSIFRSAGRKRAPRRKLRCLLCSLTGDVSRVEIRERKRARRVLRKRNQMLNLDVGNDERAKNTRHKMVNVRASPSNVDVEIILRGTDKAHLRTILIPTSRAFVIRFNNQSGRA